MTETSLPSELPWREFARAPLVPAAVASFLGIIADRSFTLPVEASFVLAAVGLLAALLVRKHAALCIALGVFALAAAHHHLHRHHFAADDIGNFATPNITVTRLRGYVDEVPVIRRADHSEFLGPARRHDRASTTLSVHEIETIDGWQPASGLARLTIERVAESADDSVLDRITIGDEIEVVGLLSSPNHPGNPGERDYALIMQDKRTRAELRVTKGAESVTRLGEPAGWSFERALASLRGHFTKIIHETLTGSDEALARALLLGDGSATDRDDWDAFARTGVVHVLVISGQHLVVLAGAVWLFLRLLGVRRRHGAVFVILFITAYALLTGGQPSAMRATVMVAVLCGSLLVRRHASAANAVALAWLLLVILDPAEVVSTGSRLSFLSVFLLIWGAGRWFAPTPLTPVEQLYYEARPPWLNLLRAAARWLFVIYAVNLILTLGNTPLLIYSNNVAPAVSILIGPPVMLLTTVALLAGFVQLLLGLIWIPLAVPFAMITGVMLNASRDIVHFAERLPGGAIYVPDVPAWWVLGFYVLLIAAVLLLSRRLAFSLVLWTLLGFFSGPDRVTDELRITFLSVGHGGCTVLETPDGRVLMYDCGTMAGPETVRRVIAPFLWQRGIRRIDELFISHADLDHYNCVPELLKRFRVGQVTLTPSFSTKQNAEVAGVLRELDAKQVPRRIVSAGEVFTAGDVMIEVLHPPAEGPPGIENERSMVLLFTHANHTLLLTGDLEKAGTNFLLNQRPRSIDAFMAPHHGAKVAFPAALAQWADPTLVLVSRGAKSSPNEALSGRNVWDTHIHGAITLHSHASGFTAETFKTQERLVLKRR